MIIEVGDLVWESICVEVKAVGAQLMVMVEVLSVHSVKGALAVSTAAVGFV